MNGKTSNTLAVTIVALLVAGLFLPMAAAAEGARDSGADKPACSDGVDNDDDGLVDYPADPGCDNKGDKDEADGAAKAACDDGKDNDGDGKIDHPSDPGCSSKTDTDETDPQQTMTRQWFVTCANDADVGFPGMGLDGVTRGEFPIAAEQVGKGFRARITTFAIVEEVGVSAGIEWYDALGTRLFAFQGYSQDGGPNLFFGFTGTVPPNAAWMIAFECGGGLSTATLTI